MKYIVIAYRWGEIPEDHTPDFKYDKDYKYYYLVDTVHYRRNAIRIADEERDNRGGKYECVVYEYENEVLEKSVYSTDNYAPVGELV